jgi:hypothetical protein
VYRFRQFIMEQENMQNTQWSNLAHANLIGNSTRLARFLNMVKTGAEFLTKKGVVIIDEEEYDRLAIEMPKSRYSTTIKAGATTLRYPTDFYKTPEFGGVGKGSKVKREDYELKSLQDQIEKAKMADGVQSIDVRIDGRTYEVAGAVTTPSTPKSDFHLVDIKGKEVVWISHKNGNLPKDVQQWGGISQQKEPGIFSHKETQQFIADLKRMFPDGVKNSFSAYRRIKDDSIPKLKPMAIYGNRYGKEFGQQNVTILLQGPVKLVKDGATYSLSANHVHPNGESLDNTPFEAVLSVRYGDRSDAGVTKARIGIMPIGARKWNYGVNGEI